MNFKQYLNKCNFQILACFNILFFLILYQLSWSNLYSECANFKYLKFHIHFTALLLPIDDKLRKVTCQSMNIWDKLWNNSEKFNVN